MIKRPVITHKLVNDITKLVRTESLLNQRLNKEMHRVGVLAKKIANYRGLDTDALFIAGSVHDINKYNISRSLLEPHNKFTRYHLELLKPHAEKGYKLLSEIADLNDEEFKSLGGDAIDTKYGKRGCDYLIAELVLRHHTLKAHSGYPENPKHNFDFSKGKHLRELETLAIADVYEALFRKDSYKEDNHFEKMKNRKILYSIFNPKVTPILDELFAVKILK